MRIYIDTNIYLDYLLARKNRYGKDLSESAFIIFKRAVACEFEIVVSGWLLRELSKYQDTEAFMALFSFLKKKIIKVIEDEEDVKQAKQYSAHYEDSLHAILAVKGKAEALITRNIYDFFCVQALIQAKLPEEL